MIDGLEAGIEEAPYVAFDRNIRKSCAAGAQIVLASLKDWDSKRTHALTPKPEPMPEGMDPVYWQHRQSQGCS